MQTAEHSHFTLLDLSHMAFTPVAAPAYSLPHEAPIPQNTYKHRPNILDEKRLHFRRTKNATTSDCFPTAAWEKGTLCFWVVLKAKTCYSSAVCGDLIESLAQPRWLKDKREIDS